MMTKKPLPDTMPKTALPRIYFIDKKIAAGEFPNTEELALEYEVSTATISRDLEFMRDRLGAPIEYSALNRGYYYSEKTYRVPASFTSAEDMQALGMAKTLLSLYRDTPIYSAAQHLLESITAPLSDTEHPGWFEKRIVVPPVASAPAAPEIWNTISTGLKKNQVITFEYRGAWDEDYKPRRVRPYQLLFDTGVWFLYGYAEERKAIRVFSLFRMKNVSLTEDSFTLPADFDYLVKEGSNFGVFAGDKKYRYRIEFYNNSAMWVKERQWAADQLIEDIDEGAVITFTSSQYWKILEWVLSQGRNARPLEPKGLVKDWELHISGMQKLVRGK
jgi:predicted DNA-binding transcriptional regulator YafY